MVLQNDDGSIHILVAEKEERGLQYDDELAPCPICGKKACVFHAVVDGFEFGWDAGCPSAKLNDGVHSFSDDDEIDEKNWPRVSYCLSKKDAIKMWNKKAKKIQRRRM